MDKLWTRTVGSLIGAIWLYTLAGIAGSIAGVASGLLNPGGLMGAIASMTDGGGSNYGPFDLLENLFPLLVLAGYYLFWRSLTRFMRLQRSDADREAVGRVRKSYLFFLVAIVAGWFWLPGRIASLVLIILGYINLFSGYSRMKKSVTLTDNARRGAGVILTANIWILIATVIGIVPLIGDAIEAAIAFIAFFSILAGWRLIQRGAPLLTDEEAATLERSEADADNAWALQWPVKAQSAWLAVFLGFRLFVMVVEVWFSKYDGSHDSFLERLLLIWYIPHRFLIEWLLMIVWGVVPLFFKNMKLGKLARAGLITTIVAFALSVVYYYAHLAPLSGVILSNVAYIAGILGPILFAWGTIINRYIKIVFMICFAVVLVWQSGVLRTVDNSKQDFNYFQEDLAAPSLPISSSGE